MTCRRSDHQEPGPTQLRVAWRRACRSTTSTPTWTWSRRRTPSSAACPSSWAAAAWAGSSPRTPRCAPRPSGRASSCSRRPSTSSGRSCSSALPPLLVGAGWGRGGAALRSPPPATVQLRCSCPRALPVGVITAGVTLRPAADCGNAPRCRHRSPPVAPPTPRARRLQAPVSGLLSRLIPRVRMVPAVRPEDMSNNPEVSSPRPASPVWCPALGRHRRRPRRRAAMSVPYATLRGRPRGARRPSRLPCDPPARRTSRRSWPTRSSSSQCCPCELAPKCSTPSVAWPRAMASSRCPSTSRTPPR